MAAFIGDLIAGKEATYIGEIELVLLGEYIKFLIGGIVLDGEATEGSVTVLVLLRKRLLVGESDVSGRIAEVLTLRSS